MRKFDEQSLQPGLLARDAFFCYIQERIDAPFEGVGELGELALAEFDSFYLMELIGAVDDLGVVIDEDVLAEVSTLGDLYEAYAIAGFGVHVDVRESS